MRERASLWITQHVAGILAVILVVMAVTACIAGTAFVTAWNAKGREIAVARHEAAKAVHQAQQAAQGNSAQREANRQLVCRLVAVNSSLTPPPTTARGFSIAAAWKQIGELSTLHCFTK